MSPLNKQVDFTMQDSVEQLLMNSELSEDGDHCMSPEDSKRLRQLPGNEMCLDCGQDDPDWASVNLGVFLCLECSGQHRALGTHVSFVRSVRMDSWSDDQLQKMTLGGGNRPCVQFLKKHGLRKHHTIRERYDCPPAFLWQQMLQARVEGRLEPTELPLVSSKLNHRQRITGFGSANNLTSAPPLVSPLQAKSNPVFDKAVGLFLKIAKRNQPQ